MKFSGLKMCECKKMTNIRYAFRNMTAKFFFPKRARNGVFDQNTCLCLIFLYLGGGILGTLLPPFLEQIYKVVFDPFPIESEEVNVKKVL